MNTKEMIEVMQAFEDGQEIDLRLINDMKWDECQGPVWDWHDYIYRIRPKQTLEDRIKAEYSGFDVVMLEWYEDIWSIKRSHKGFNCHTVAQSMRGFYEYVYIVQSEIADGEIDFYTSREPTEPYDILEDVKTIHPIGALFTRAGE